jgi:AcrR family transcriptional regulator
MPVNVLAAPSVTPSVERGPAREWLDRITDHIVEHGLRDASLRRLATIAGTGHVQLRYYFGSRDGLLGAVLHDLRRRHSFAFTAAATSRRELLTNAWSHFSTPEHELEMRLFFHIAGVAVETPAGYSQFLDSVVATWVEAGTELGVREGLPYERAKSEARLMAAAVRGLLLDRLLTGEQAAVDAAFMRLLDLLDPPVRS